MVVLFTECNCFGHADRCVYNETVSDLGLSLNIERVYSGGGVCQDCRVSNSMSRVMKIIVKGGGVVSAVD